ncbi:hypothetical protein [Moraxella lacunata]|uniref:hypothetical protein n=1 Tax=Moraxella lacunata TaxID=477 RepID=UPI003EE13A92
MGWEMVVGAEEVLGVEQAVMDSTMPSAKIRCWVFILVFQNRVRVDVMMSGY